MIATPEVGRLSVRGTAQDTPALRAAVEGRVRSADLQPATLPPAAILVVRRMAVATALRPWATTDGWDGACRDRLAAAAAHAARPDRGLVPSSATAVLFRDAAELLACLALDLARGEAGRRWWWALVLARYRGAAAGPAALLAGDPIAAPAAVAELHAWGAVEPVLAAVATAEIPQLLRALARTHEAPALEALAAAVEANPRAAPAGNRLPTLPSPPVAGAGTSAERAAGARVPASPGRHAAPAVPAAPAGLDGARRLLLAVALTLHARPQAARTASFARALLGEPAAVPLPAAGRRPAAGPPRGGRADGGRRGSEAVVAVGARRHGAAAAAPDGAAARVTPAAASPATLEADAAPRPRAREPAAADESPAPRAEGVRTELGGAFFLVTVVARLDLLAARGIEEQLGAWGVLDALARGLLAADVPDPLWELLADLAGRAADAPLHTPATARWCDRVVPCVRGRLARALDVKPDAVATEFLVRPGTVHVTRTHVDVVMPLRAVSLKVRRAGLDADPGWCAAFGRVIRVHFEEAA